MDHRFERKLGSSGVALTALGFGAAPIGGFRFAIAEDEATGAVRTAYDAGIGYFDTSPYYGYGRSELRVGQVLREEPRDGFVLSTKIGRVMSPHRPDDATPPLRPNGLPFDERFDYSYDGVMRSLEQSYLRLGMNRIDVVYIHDVDIFSHGTPDAYARAYAAVLEGAVPALEELRRNGVIGAFGAGLNDTEPCLRFARDTSIDCLLVAGRYTLLVQEAMDELLPLCAERNIGVVIGGPYNSGILVHGPKEGSTYFYKPAPAGIRERVAGIEAVCARHGVPMAAAALQFPLHHPCVVSTIPGAISRAEVRQGVAWMRMAIPDALWAELKQEGLLRADAPVPG